jgi:hypothetical protein
MRKLLCFRIVAFGRYYAVPSVCMYILSGGLFCLLCYAARPSYRRLWNHLILIIQPWGRPTENTGSSIVACWLTAAEMRLPRTHREHHLQHLFYCCMTSQYTWHIPLLHVYGPLPSNNCFSASIVLALSKYATIFFLINCISFIAFNLIDWNKIHASWICGTDVIASFNITYNAAVWVLKWPH